MGWIFCWFGIHKYNDQIEVKGPPDKQGLPVRIYEKCARCNKIRNDVRVFLTPQDQTKKTDV